MGFQFSCLTQRIILDFRGQRLIRAGETKTNENHLSFSPHLKIKKENQLTKQTICFIIPLIWKLDFKKKKKGGDLGKIQNLLLEIRICVHEVNTQAVHGTVVNAVTLLQGQLSGYSASAPLPELLTDRNS